MDVLSEVLKAVRLEGAMFYHGEFSAPWSFRSPPAATVATYLSCQGKQVIIFHLLTDGRGWAQLDGNAPVALEAGDIVVFPHGDAHLMGNGPKVEPVDNERQIEQILGSGLKIARMGGGGEVTRYICGYMSVDPHVSRIVLGGLPRLLRVRIRNDAAGRWLEDSIRFSVEEAGDSRPGSEAFLAKLSEALFVETLRRHVADSGAPQKGWLAGARDPQVGRALLLLHGSPGRHWALAELAREAGVSRTVLAERFQRYIGETPIGYLARWRLQLAARELTETLHSVLEVAMHAGYGSEASFNRAFKREFGVPPAQFRREAKSKVRVATG
jgi:AraC-like DNA-binding protein